VRVPVRFSGHAGDSPPYAIDAEFMARVRHVVDTSLAAGLNVILNMHHYDEVFTAPEQHRDRFASLWRQIATEFRDAPAGLWFELINEPHERLKRQQPQQPACPGPGCAAGNQPDPAGNRRRPELVRNRLAGDRSSCPTIPTSCRPFIIMSRSTSPTRAPPG
jgi:hypothetical protein